MADGDTNEFYVPDEVILTVSELSGNHHDIIRQRLAEGQTFSVRTSWYGIKIYAEYVLVGSSGFRGQRLALREDEIVGLPEGRQHSSVEVLQLQLPQLAHAGPVPLLAGHVGQIDNPPANVCYAARKQALYFSLY